MPETAKRTARVPILGEDGRISDDYIPAAIGENVTKAESAATRAESAKTDAEAAKTGAESFANNAVAQAQAAKESADGARGSASRAQQSATAAQRSATEAGERADSVLDHYVESATATTLDPGQPATAEVVDKVLNLGIPRGEKGDRGDTGTGVPEGGTPGQLLSKTDSGTAWVDPPSTGNVLVGTATGYVAHAEDAYAQKPVEVRVKGRTVKNLWVNPNTSHNSASATSNADGSVKVSGTPTAQFNLHSAKSFVLRPGSTYYLSCSPAPSGFAVGISQYVDGSFKSTKRMPDGGGAVTIDSDVDYVTFVLYGEATGTPLSGTYRVMLNEGSEAPDCFTPPASITSVQTGNLVTAGKNLAAADLDATDAGVKISSEDDGAVSFVGTATSYFPQSFCPIYLPSNVDMVASQMVTGSVGEGGRCYFKVLGVLGLEGIALATTRDADGVAFNTGEFDSYRFLAVVEGNGITFNCKLYPQLELGSTATAYEPPNITQTPLPEAELRSLPNGTCDELVIGADGTATVERRTQLSGGEVTALPEPTTETLDAVSLPKLPAPTFNIHHDSQVPSDTSVEYERDINLVLANLEAVQAALLGGE